MEGKWRAWSRVKQRIELQGPSGVERSSDVDSEHAAGHQRYRGPQLLCVGARDLALEFSSALTRACWPCMPPTSSPCDHALLPLALPGHLCIQPCAGDYYSGLSVKGAGSCVFPPRPVDKGPGVW